jgi:Peptidase A4 family
MSVTHAGGRARRHQVTIAAFFALAALGGTSVAAAGTSRAAQPSNGPARVLHGVDPLSSGGPIDPHPTSTNWSGYLVLHANVHYVHARWVVPKATCVAHDSNNQDSTFWVGLDGWSDGTVEQAGTDVRCAPGSTHPTYVSWWEMYPTNFVQDVYAVAPGDLIDAAVTFAGGRYTLVVKDLTSGKAFTRRQACADDQTCANSSAEWIAESPSYGSSLADLAHYKTWKPTSMTLYAGTSTSPVGPATYPTYPITMVTSDSAARTRAKVSAHLLTAAKNSFVDTFVYGPVT